MIKKLDIDGVSYYELYAACPICPMCNDHEDKDFLSHRVYWKHIEPGYNCGGRIYIGDNALLYCESCKKTSYTTCCHLESSSEKCLHSKNKGKDNTVDFNDTSNISLSAASYLGVQMSYQVGLPWTIRFIENLPRQNIKNHITACEEKV